jgi:hypothetical protein
MKREIDMKHRNEVETAQQTNEPKVLAGDGIDRRSFLQCMAWAGTDSVVPDAKMEFYVPKAGERRDLIAYFKR